MSMYSGLTRDKNGVLLRDGKPVILGCDTGDDTPVIQDERLDIDLNRLVSNEMARQETFRVPGSGDFADLTDFPASRGDAEQRALELQRQLNPHMLPGENYEIALQRIQQAQARALSAQRDFNAKTPTPDANAPTTSPNSETVQPPVNTQNKP